MAALIDGMQYFDVGNHHFPSVARTALAQRLVDSAPASITKVAFGSGGGEAIDIALKSARHATQRRKIVSIIKAYHGHTGLAVATGDDRFSKLFLSDRPDEFVQVPFGDVDAMEQALSRRRRRGRHHGDDPRDVRIPAAPNGLPRGGQGTHRPPRHALHRRRGADRTDAHRRDVGHHQARHRTRHHGRGQGPVRRHVPDHRGDARRAGRAVARPGRLRPHLDVRRRRTRLRRRHQDPGDHQPPRGAGVGARTSPTSSPTGWPASRPTTRTGSSASGRTAW